MIIIYDIITVRIPKPTETIWFNETKIIMVGIIHNSKVSLEYVKDIVKSTNEKVPILLEYCKTRFEANELKQKNTIWHILTKTELLIESYVIRHCMKYNRPIWFIDKDIRWSLKQHYKNKPILFIKDLIVQLLKPGLATIEYDENYIEKMENVTEYTFDPETYWWIIEKRNKHMVNEIKHYIEINKPRKVIVVVGRAHVSGILAGLV